MVDACMRGDEDGVRWVFGKEPLEAEDIPPREIILELFHAREFVFQLRVQYELLRKGIKLTLGFMTSPLPQLLKFQLLGSLRRVNLLVDPDLVFAIVSTIWENPGIDDAELIQTYQARCERAGLRPDFDLPPRVLAFLELDYIISRAEVGSTGWYLTGRNPMRMRQDAQEETGRMNTGADQRSWSAQF